MDSDSIRRQTAAAKAWADRQGFPIDLDTYKNKGLSALHGDHIRNDVAGGLGAFLKGIRTGDIPKGSYLVVEDMSRLTRQGGWAAMMLIGNIVESEIKLVLLRPRELVITKSQELHDMLYVLMEVERSHGESKVKAGSIKTIWDDFRATGGSRPGAVPFWLDRIREDDRTGRAARKYDKYELNEWASVVQDVFKLTLEGHGTMGICRLLKDRMPMKGRALSHSYITYLLRFSGVWGRCELSDRDDAYPVAVSRDVFYRVQSVLSGKKRSGGKNTGAVHLLTGLLRHRITGSTYIPHHANKGKQAVFFPGDYKRGGLTPLVGLTVEATEEAVLTCLQRCDWSTVFKGDGGNEIAEIGGELAELTDKIAHTQNLMDKAKKPSPSMVKSLERWDERIEALKSRLAELRAASPRATQAGELAGLLKGDCWPVNSPSWHQWKATMKRVVEDVDFRRRVKSLVGSVVERIDVEFRRYGIWIQAHGVVHIKGSDSQQFFRVCRRKPHKGVPAVMLLTVFADTLDDWENHFALANDECDEQDGHRRGESVPQVSSS